MCCCVAQVLQSNVQNVYNILLIRMSNFHYCKIADLIAFLLSEFTYFWDFVGLVGELCSRFTFCVNKNGCNFNTLEQASLAWRL